MLIDTSCDGAHAAEAVRFPVGPGSAPRVTLEFTQTAQAAVRSRDIHTGQGHRGPYRVTTWLDCSSILRYLEIVNFLWNDWLAEGRRNFNLVDSCRLVRGDVKIDKDVISI